MNTQFKGGNWTLLALVFLVGVMSVGCMQAAESCPPPEHIDISGGVEFAADDQYPFQFPLEGAWWYESAQPFSTAFATYADPFRGMEYHAAEDILRSPGTKVHAIAAGRVSYSGPMGGYGWLVIIDHPKLDLYSLYGHLSPSRWEIESGTVVEKGQLIGYLGDDYENGGSVENPMRPHLHFGVRLGQRADYSGLGQWRWQAGWIRLCPQDAGWLQPSLVIMKQNADIAKGIRPTVGILTIWRVEILFSVMYSVGAIGVIVVTTRRQYPLPLLVSGLVFIALGWTFMNRSILVTAVGFGFSVVLWAWGITIWLRSSRVILESGGNEGGDD